MKKVFLLALLIPLLGISQTKNVINSFRVSARPGKTLELEKALAAHAKKYHTGDWKWRVYAIQTGPDAGGYHIVEGPNTWAALDSRGDLGVEHTTDLDKNIGPLTTGAGTQSYSTYEEDLSTVQLTDYSDKIIIAHMFPKPGMVNGVIDLIRKLKKVWTAGNESVAVYSSFSSGPPQYTMVTRLKGGLKELDPSFRKPMPERFNAVYGEKGWESYLEDYAKFVENRWGEMLLYRADLSSK